MPRFSARAYLPGEEQVNLQPETCPGADPVPQSPEEMRIYEEMSDAEMSDAMRGDVGADRLVLIGASNLTAGLRYALEEALHFCPDLDVFAAHGPGRSYGETHGVLCMGYDGHVSSGLFDAVDAAQSESPRSLKVLLTDLGNDLLYGPTVDTILAWVDSIVERANRHAAELRITSLPIESLESLTPAKFQVLRRLFFPFRPTEYQDVLQRTRDLQKGIEELSRMHERLEVLPVERVWYGFDHIHVRRRDRRTAFHTWLQTFWPESRTKDASPNVGRLLRFRPPRHFRVLGLKLRGPQSSVLAAPGLTVTVY
ncbi:MAG: hypothetical protein AAF517_00840 [Planctomycetota bacterium]